MPYGQTCTHAHTSHLSLLHTWIFVSNILYIYSSNLTQLVWLTCFCICASCSHTAAIRSPPSTVLWTAAIHMSLRLEARQTGLTSKNKSSALASTHTFSVTETCYPGFSFIIQCCQKTRIQYRALQGAMVQNEAISNLAQPWISPAIHLWAKWMEPSATESIHRNRRTWRVGGLATDVGI